MLQPNLTCYICNSNKYMPQTIVDFVNYGNGPLLRIHRVAKMYENTDRSTGHGKMVLSHAFLST